MGVDERSGDLILISSIIAAAGRRPAVRLFRTPIMLIMSINQELSRVVHPDPPRGAEPPRPAVAAARALQPRRAACATLRVAHPGGRHRRHPEAQARQERGYPGA